MDVKLTWKCDGIHTTFNIYRSNQPIRKDNLPTPIATNVTAYQYLDIDITDSISYYAVGNSTYLSDTLKAEKLTYDVYMSTLNPVAWYKMSESSSNVLVDSSLNEYHGTFRAEQSAYHLFQQIPLRKDSLGSMSFNLAAPALWSGGIPQCIAPAVPALYNLSKGSFSICFWAKRKGDSYYNQIITQCANPGSGRDTNFRILGDVSLQIEENARQLDLPGIDQDEVAFYCFCWDTVNSLYYGYKNNTKANGQYSHNLAGGRSVTTHFPAYFDWNYYAFKGYMSDVTFFNKALTDEEILLLYDLGKL